jgi:glycine/D-amino acid oxidase-like deaminating enzyme/nitrite reductase/ring-hydroxylating ferredoxin subunit
MGILDERNPSLWVKTTPETSYPALEREASYDAIVIGGGITGLTTAYLLKREGLKVALLEAGRIASGVTGYTTAKVTALHALIYQELLSKHGQELTSTYGRANAAAVERIVDIATAEEIDCDLERRDAYTFAASTDGIDAVRREADAVREAGLAAELVDRAPLPFPATAVRMANQAEFHPRKYCIGLAAAIDGGKGKVFEHSRVSEVEEKKTVVRVKTEKETLSTENVVVATQLPFMGDGMFYAKTYPLRAYAVAIPTKEDAIEGMFISAESPSRSLRTYRAGKKTWVIVSGESHKVGQDPEPEEHYEALARWAKEKLPGAGEPEFRWSAQDYVSVDGVPYIGPLTKENERVFVATGFRKWGMTNGTVAAHIICDAIMSRENQWAEAFDSTRVKPRRAVKDFVKENANVARHLVLDKALASETTLESLTAGEAAFVDLEGETAAAYRDERGELHVVSPDCTHMGCRLSWNKAECSWDCPCHGSRFDPDGRVIQGPANQDLERKEVRETAKGRR